MKHTHTHTHTHTNTHTHIQHTQVVTLLPRVQNEQSLISLMVTSGERNTKPNWGDFMAAIKVILKIDTISGGWPTDWCIISNVWCESESGCQVSSSHYRDVLGNGAPSVSAFMRATLGTHQLSRTQVGRQWYGTVLGNVLLNLTERRVSS